MLVFYVISVTLTCQRSIIMIYWWFIIHNVVYKYRHSGFYNENTHVSILCNIEVYRHIWKLAVSEACAWFKKIHQCMNDSGRCRCDQCRRQAICNQYILLTHWVEFNQLDQSFASHISYFIFQLFFFLPKNMRIFFYCRPFQLKPSSYIFFFINIASIRLYL